VADLRNNEIRNDQWAGRPIKISSTAFVVGVFGKCGGDEWSRID